MMNILKSKQGIGLPAVLAIVAFVLGTTATFLSYIFFQASLTDIAIEESETYANAVADVRGALYLIARDQSLDPAYLSALENLMNVDIETYGDNLYTVSSRTLIGTQPIRSYLTGSITTIDTYDTIFKYTGEEPTFELSPLITPTNLMTGYLEEFLTTNYPSITIPDTLTDFASVVSYLKTLSEFTKKGTSYLNNNPTVTTNLFITGSTTISKNKTITVSPGNLVVIEGNLTLSEGAKFYGNVIVKGNVLVKGPNKKVPGIAEGTFYMSGNFTTYKGTTLGSIERPTFIFAEGDVDLDNQTTGVAYILAENINAQQGNIIITGGAYAFQDLDIQTEIQENEFLNLDAFYEYAIPEQIPIESDGIGEGETGFIFTTPKLG